MSEDTYDVSEFQGLFQDAEADRADWKAAGEFRSNDDFLRLKDFAMLLLNPEPGMTVLELGIGGGANAVPIFLQGASVAGIDLDEIRIQRAKAHLSHFGMADTSAIKVGDATKLDFNNNEFDATVLIGLS